VLALEIFGVNATMQQVADYYTEEGYTELVPDLFWRQEPNVEPGYSEADWQRASGFYQGFGEAQGVEDIQVSLSALRQRPEMVGKAGVLGFCLGGKLAYLAACRTDADVAVGYYGVGIEKALDEMTLKRDRCSRLPTAGFACFLFAGKYNHAGGTRGTYELSRRS
jgi:carboxymethylenebutenolidase